MKGFAVHVQEKQILLCLKSTLENQPEQSVHPFSAAKSAAHWLQLMERPLRAPEPVQAGSGDFTHWVAVCCQKSILKDLYLLMENVSSLKMFRGI